MHPRLAPQLQRREQMVSDDTIDWGMAEALAVGSLLMEGRTVRLAGQDSRRGTFGHRHMVIVDSETGVAIQPLKSCYAMGRSSTSTTHSLASSLPWALSMDTPSPAPMPGDVGGAVR